MIVLGLGLGLFLDHETLSALDAVLAATVLASDRLTGLVSADAAISPEVVEKVSHLEHVRTVKTLKF